MLDREPDLINSLRDDDPLKWTPLLYAVSGADFGQYETVNLLLARGADVDARDWRGRTALSRIVLRPQRRAIIMLLLERGASVDLADHEGSTPLHFVAGWGTTEMAVLLLERGANVNAQSNSRRTPLHQACDIRRGSQEPMCQLLIDYGANTELKNSAGFGPGLRYEYKQMGATAPVHRNDDPDSG